MNSPYKSKFKVTQEFKGSIHDGLDLVGIGSKQIHSTINGTVEKAGWENPANKAQGFGLYVRIKKNSSSDKYYFGHLSKICVSAGSKVKIGDLIGLEGSTGKSTGSHCHYCIRTNGLKSQVKDVSKISGIPNALGTYSPQESKATKSIAEVAKEVIGGKWGNGEERKKRLIEAGYNYSAIQAEVNRQLSPTIPNKKSNQEIAKEVIGGKWGNGKERKTRLVAEGYNYAEIQKIVNQMLK